MLSHLRQIIRKRRELGELLEALPVVQAQCKHEHVGQSIDLECLPVRICLGCGLEEAGCIFSTDTHWSRRGYDSLSKLGNTDGRKIQALEQIDYQRMRVRAA